MISGDEAVSEIGISVPQVRGHERTEGFWEGETGHRAPAVHKRINGTSDGLTSREPGIYCT